MTYTVQEYSAYWGQWRRTATVSTLEAAKRWARVGLNDAGRGDAKRIIDGDGKVVWEKDAI